MRVIRRQIDSAPDVGRAIERVLSGDSEAYGPLVRAYQKQVFGVCLRLLRDRAEAECVAQEAFLKAYQALGDFRGGSTFETWVTRIAINACRDRFKRKRLVRYFHQVLSPEDAGDPSELAPSGDPSPERLVLSREIQEQLRAAVARLSPQQRAVFTLKHFEERSIPEIAQLLDLDSGTVKSHLFRAATKIRSRLRHLWRSR